MVPSVAERAVLAYSVDGPEHPGKWRVVDLLVRLTDLHRRCKGRELIAERNGVRWQLLLDDWVQRTVYVYGEWDSREVDYILERLTPGAVFLDIGAHFGYYSLLVARRHGLAVRAYAFEPVESNFRRLTTNIALNRFKSVEAVRSAVGAELGRIAFELPPAQNPGSGHAVAGTGGSADVPVTTVDAFVTDRALERVDVMKIDIEGMELAALRGARRTLELFQPDIVLELNPSALHEQGETARGLIDLLGESGYELYECAKRGLRPFDAARIETDATLRTGYVNLICRPSAALAARGH